MNNVVRGREKYYIYFKITNKITKYIKILPLNFRKKLFSMFQGTHGLIGIGIRYVLIKSIAKKCGENVSIHSNVYIFKPENLVLGSNVSVHPMSYIDSTGQIEIGNDVSIAHGVTILSSSHNFSSYTLPIKDQGISLNETIIENNVWLGAKSTILSGISIKENSIVGASSVVTKTHNKGDIIIGVPGKAIKKVNK
ncbi:acyltransferase [Staphylococcus equorum]|uniref:acyltransferase n=1 Tax=Staphylococcus equorum TaxID=246432 RepID=UPI0020CB9B33|nr:acyltransferase [Staphylococcus equorum]MEB7715530.1 acyltransferase [Staphylococcus equorum]MEB7759885.1 acyltransferase [Staphylococcus equorum]MEB7762360.1 acyltransferase [Staphylococcus equorum]MEB7793474.1 acyltransferase [Staphylococcus equorum]UTT55870.1 acyltransferase [Staphylococcus equorum]